MTQQNAKPADGPKPARRRAREAALQALYGWQVGSQDLAACETALHEVEGFNTLRNLEQNFAIGLLRGSIAQHETLREQLTPLLDRPFEELSPVEACILLIGAYEMLAAVINSTGLGLEPEAEMTLAEAKIHPA